MSEYVNLREPGSERVVFAKTITVDTSGKWPDYHISDGTTTVVVPKNAADRQVAGPLKRQSIMELLGGWVRVSRTEKLAANGNPYWDLQIVPPPAPEPVSDRVASPYAPPRAVEPAPVADAAPAAPAAPASAADHTAERQAALEVLLGTYETVLASMERTHVESGVPLTAEAVVSLTATLFIHYTRRGLV